MFVTVTSGAIAFGSAAWGQIAAVFGLPFAHFAAVAGALLTIPLTWRWKVQTAAGLDLTPSMHWPAPVITHDIEQDQGPVLVTVEYEIKMETRGQFLTAIQKVARERRRDGAYAWGIFEDVAVAGRFIEVFYLDSWLEHLRQHHRVTKANRALEEKIVRLSVRGEPKVTHLICARASRTTLSVKR